MKDLKIINTKRAYITALYTALLFSTLTSLTAKAERGARKKIEVTYLKKSQTLLLFTIDKASTYKRSNTIKRTQKHVTSTKVRDTLKVFPAGIL
jgi:hypothetical protein